MLVKRTKTKKNQLCNLYSIKGLQRAFQKVPFYVAKGHLLHCKRACFAMQKGVFYNAKEHVLKSTGGINLTKGDITSNRRNVL